MLGRRVRRRSRNVSVRGDARDEDQAAIACWVLLVEVVHGELGCVQDGDEVDLHDAEVGLLGFIGGFFLLSIGIEI